MNSRIPFFFALGLTLSATSILLAQKPNLDFINMEIANEISRMEMLFNGDPTEVSGKLGPMMNGGNCTLQIIVTDKATGLSYTYTVPFITDDLCKNYKLETEQDGFIKVVPINPDPPGLSPVDLAALQQLLQFLGQVEKPAIPVEGKVKIGGLPPQSANEQDQKEFDTVQGPLEVFDLPLEPPLSVGTKVSSPDGCRPDKSYTFFRVNHFDNSVTRFDGCPAKPTITIRGFATNPLQAAVTPDGKTLIVTSYNQGITFIDLSTNRVSKSLNTPGDAYPSGIAIRKDGAIAYVTSLIDDNPAVLVIDVVNRAIIGRIPLTLAYPQSVYFSPDGLIALVTFPLTNSVVVIDVLTSTVSTQISIIGPHDIAFNPTGTRAYITSGAAPGTVKVIDTATFQTIDTYNLGGNPGYVQISDDGRFLSVMDYDSNKVWNVELATRRIVTVTTASAGGGLFQLP